MMSTVMSQPSKCSGTLFEIDTISILRVFDSCCLIDWSCQQSSCPRYSPDSSAGDWWTVHSAVFEGHAKLADCSSQQHGLWANSKLGTPRCCAQFHQAATEQNAHWIYWTPDQLFKLNASHGSSVILGFYYAAKLVVYIYTVLFLLLQVPRCPCDYEQWLVTRYAEFGTKWHGLHTGPSWQHYNHLELWCAQEMWLYYSMF